MDIYIVSGSCGIIGDIKAWIVDAWETQSDADIRITELEDLKMRFWGDTSDMSSYAIFNQGRIVEDKMRAAENGDPGYTTDVFSATSYHVEKIKLKSWQDKESDSEMKLRGLWNRTVW